MSDFNDFELDEQLRSIAAAARDRVTNDVRNQLPDDSSRDATTSTVLPMEPRPNKTLDGSRRWWSISAAAAVVAIAIGGFVILNGGDEGMISPTTQPNTPATTGPSRPTTVSPATTAPPSNEATEFEFDIAAAFGDNVEPEAISVTGDGRVIAAARSQLLVLAADANVQPIDLPADLAATRSWVGADDIAVVWGGGQGVEIDLTTGEIVSELTRADGTWTRTITRPDDYVEHEGRPESPLDLGQLTRAPDWIPTFEGAGCQETIGFEGGPMWVIGRPAECVALTDEIAPLVNGGFVVTLSAENDPSVYPYVLRPDGTVGALPARNADGVRLDAQPSPNGVAILTIDGTTATIVTIPLDDVVGTQPPGTAAVQGTPAPATTAPPTTAPQDEDVPEFLDGMRWERTDLPADCAQQQQWPSCQFGHTLEGVLIQLDGNRIIRHDSSESLSAQVEGLGQGWLVTVGPDEIAYLGLPPDAESGGSLIAVSVAQDDFGTELQRWPDLIPLGDSDLVPSADGLRSTGWYANDPRPDLTTPPILEWLERDDANTLVPPDVVYDPSSNRVTVGEQTWDLPVDIPQPIGYPLSLTPTFDGGFLTTMGTETLDEPEWLVRGWPNGEVDTLKVTDRLQSEPEWVKTAPDGTILVADPEGMIRAYPFETEPEPTATTTAAPTSTNPADRLAGWPAAPDVPASVEDIPRYLPATPIEFAGTPVAWQSEGGSAAPPMFTQVFANAEQDVLLMIQSRPNGIETTPDEQREPVAIVGWDNAFTTSGVGGLRLVAEDAGGFVRLMGTGLTNDQAAAIVESMQRRSDGVPGWDLEPDNDLVEINGAWTDSAGQRTVAWYEGNRLVAEMLVSPVHTFRIEQALSSGFDRVDVDGADGWLNTDVDRRSIVWSPDGTNFVVLGVADDRIDPLAIAESVSEVDPTEYESMTTTEFPEGIGDGCNSLFC